jgi:hypothetical protein
MWDPALKIAVQDEEEKEDDEMTEDERKNWICFADLNCGETPRYDKAMEG